MTAPPEKSASVTQKIGSYSFKISDDLFSHHPIFIDQSLQHTGFAPLFTQLTNEVPHFAPPLQIVLLPALFTQYLPQFSFINTKTLQKYFFGHRFCALPSPAPGDHCSPSPPYATASIEFF